MGELLGNNSPESFGDSLRLLNLLDTLEVELEVPYLERRKRGNTQKTTPLEELQDAIQEITQREKDLQASIGISKMLLEANNALIAKNNTLTEEKVKIEENLSNHKQELARIKEELYHTTEKYQDMNAELAHSEAQCIKLQSKLKKTTEEHPASILNTSTMSADQYEIEINEISEKFKKEYEYIHSNLYLGAKVEAEKKVKTLEGKQAEAQEILAKLDIEVKDLVKHNEKLEKIKAKIEEDLSREKGVKEEIEKKYDEIYQTYSALMTHAEKQSDEIDALQEVIKLRNSPIKVPSHNPSNSLKDELEETFAETADEPFPDFVDFFLKKPEFSASNLRNSFRASPRTLGLYRGISILAEPRKYRKNPGEEYFTLITQAIKLNSPYMDVICVISPKYLFELALKNDIPFHKWHIWVEKQLNASYLQSIYQRNSLISHL